MSIHYHIANVKIFSVFCLFQAKKFQIFFHTLHTTQPNKRRKALHFNILNTNKRIKYALLRKTGHARYIIVQTIKYIPETYRTLCGQRFRREAYRLGHDRVLHRRPIGHVRCRKPQRRPPSRAKQPCGSLSDRDKIFAFRERSPDNNRLFRI